MKIDGNVTISELIEKMEKDIAEQTTFLEAMKKFVVISAAEPNGNGNGAAPLATAVKERKAPPKKIKLTIADRAERLLNAAKVPLPQTELRDIMREKGIAEAKRPNFLSGLYTALFRKPEVFVRLVNNKWALAKWDISKLNKDAQAEIDAQTGAGLFETE